jgi:hypothetical protein
MPCLKSHGRPLSDLSSYEIAVKTVLRKHGWASEHQGEEDGHERLRQPKS